MKPNVLLSYNYFEETKSLETPKTKFHALLKVQKADIQRKCTIRRTSHNFDKFRWIHSLLQFHKQTCMNYLIQCKNVFFSIQIISHTWESISN